MPGPPDPVGGGRGFEHDFKFGSEANWGFEFDFAGVGNGSSYPAMFWRGNIKLRAKPQILTRNVDPHIDTCDARSAASEIDIVSNLHFTSLT